MNALTDENAPGSARRETALSILLGVLPFLIIGAGMAAMELPAGWFRSETTIRVVGLILFGGYPLILAGVLAGWLAGFPRWSLPYLFYAALFALYISFCATPGLKIFGIEMWGRQMWGLRAWVPLLVVILLAGVLTRSFTRPLGQLWRGVTSDWTMLAFGLYGFTPMIAIFMDEIDHEFSFPVIIAAELILALGALLYMLIGKKAPRFLALVGSAVLAALVLGTASGYYWQMFDINMQTGQRFLNGNTPNLAGAFLGDGLRSAACVLPVFFIPAFIWLLGDINRRRARQA